MPTLNLNDMLGGVNVFGPTGLNTNLRQQEEIPPAPPAMHATAFTGHHYTSVAPMQESLSALESRIGELDAANDDIYQKLDTLQEQNERRLSVDNQEQVQVQEQVQEEKDVVISIMKTKKTTEVVLANSILESISNLVKKG